MTHPFSPTVFLLVGLLVGTLGLTAGCQNDAQDTSTYADETAQEHAGDRPEATALAMEPLIPVAARNVEYGTIDGEAVVGYQAEPQRPDSVLAAMNDSLASLPALLVIHEWWGLNDNIEMMARRLAGEGYRVLAVDLYDGATADTPDEARQLMQNALDDEEALLQNLRAAYAYLNERYDPPETGVLGWCFGGSMALRAALAKPEALDAAVIYYGRVSDAEPEQLADLDLPILGIFGGEDQSIPVEEVRAFEQTLQELDKEAQIHVYENAGHAFANPSGRNYAPEAAQQAWEQTKTFLARHLYDAAPRNVPTVGSGS